MRFDAAAAAVFGAAAAPLAGLAEAVKAHLSPPEPLVLKYTIR